MVEEEGEGQRRDWIYILCVVGNERKEGVGHMLQERGKLLWILNSVVLFAAGYER